MLSLVLYACTDDGADSSVLTDSTGETTHTGTSVGTSDTSVPVTGTTGEDPTAEETLREGFLWGYPLVFSMRTTHERPYNQMFWNTQRPNEAADHVPNPDVLYGIAAVDLRTEPAVVHATELTDRYWCLQFSDLYAESFHYVGTRATDGLGGEYLLVAPGWSGDPGAYEVIEAPTDRVVILGRLHVRDDADVAAAAALTPGYWVKPLSVVQGGGTPPDVETWDWPLVRDDTGTNGILFWDELSRSMELSPPRPEEQPIADALLELGIGPGLMPSIQTTDPALRDLLTAIPGEGVAEVQAAALAYKNWVPQLGLGQFEGDWLARAAWAYDGWLTQVQEEAVYTRSELLDGTRSWILRFDPGELPPAGAFWSITVYSEDGHLVSNPIDRFSFQDAELTYGPYGGVDITFSATYPGDGVRNWMPTPNAPFSAALRTYLPQPSMLDGTWQPPAFQALPDLNPED